MLYIGNDCKLRGSCINLRFKNVKKNCTLVKSLKVVSTINDDDDDDGSLIYALRRYSYHLLTPDSLVIAQTSH